MPSIASHTTIPPHHWFNEQDCSLSEFAAQLGLGAADADLRFASTIAQQVPIYDCSRLDGMLEDPDQRRRLLGEWVEVLLHGAGVLVLRHACTDLRVIDQATDLFEAIIADEHAAGLGGADHFAKAGANDRIWNALEKMALRNPEVFARYYANPVIHAICEAWLGPHYQMTSQVNVVRPGGQAQQAHRDYHLGFQTAEEVRNYPSHVHTMSPFLTLQGAIAHVDMPVESGPTKLLPYSQRYVPGYLAWRQPAFRDYFEAHYIQLPLLKGDALFFNPALFHAAGANHTPDVARMANLLQVGSAYGRSMETVNRMAICQAIYPWLARWNHGGGLTAAEQEAVIAASAEGYPFPCNLDRDPPKGGLAPPSQQQLLDQALRHGWSVDRFRLALVEHARRRCTDSQDSVSH
ncbi:phytanoyl-CoA dioxygenase family protein [Frateuria aurantia]